MLNLKHLHFFLAVAKAGAVNRAAEKLYLAPQTLSGQLTQFEQRLGVALFRRSGRSLELTETGRLTATPSPDIDNMALSVAASHIKCGHLNP